MKISRIFLGIGVLVAASLACITGGGSDLAGCVAATVDVVSAGGIAVDVDGTVTNNCDEDVNYAKVVATCYNASGDVVGRDEEYVENLAVGRSKTFAALVADDGRATDRCSAVVEEAG